MAHLSANRIWAEEEPCLWVPEQCRLPRTLEDPVPAVLEQVEPCLDCPCIPWVLCIQWGEVLDGLMDRSDPDQVDPDQVDSDRYHQEEVLEVHHPILDLCRQEEALEDLVRFLVRIQTGSLAQGKGIMDHLEALEALVLALVLALEASTLIHTALQAQEGSMAPLALVRAGTVPLTRVSTVLALVDLVDLEDLVSTVLAGLVSMVLTLANTDLALTKGDLALTKALALMAPTLVSMDPDLAPTPTLLPPPPTTHLQLPPLTLTLPIRPNRLLLT